MAPRTTYANLADGLQALGLWDASLADMGKLGVTPCSATGTNALVLTSVAAAFAPAVAYANNNQFGFVAPATSTGVVTAKVDSLGTLNVYRNDGVTQATSGDVVIKGFYSLIYSAALNAGAGGFYISGSAASTSTSNISYTAPYTGAVSEVLNTKLAETISAKDFGATGNGATDDTTALQNFLNACADNGVVGYIPPGNYLFTTLSLQDTLTRSFSGVLIEGASSALNSPKTRLFTNASSGIAVTIGGRATSVFQNRMTLRNITFEAANVAFSGTLLRLVSISDSTFENIQPKANNTTATLIDGNEWVGLTFNQGYIRNAATGVKVVSVAGLSSFANVITFNGTTFAGLTTSSDFSLTGDTITFNQCVGEPTQGGAASANFTGTFDTTFNECWFGDANGTGTWITAAGEKLIVNGGHISAGAIGIDNRAVRESIITGVTIDATVNAIKVSTASAEKALIANNRILLTANNAIGINILNGAGHAVFDNDVANSGTLTGTVGYVFASGTTGKFRDLLPGATNTVFTNAGTWTVETNSVNTPLFATPTITTPVINGTVTGTGVGASNVANTVVQRDPSGNFAAGQVNVTGQNISGLTASSTVATDGSKNLVSVTNTGTGNNVLATSPVLTTPNIGAATAATINGAALDNSAWTSYSPTISSSGGTFTLASATGRWKAIGKTIFVEATGVITTVGTATGLVNISLPTAAFAGTTYNLAGSSSAGYQITAGIAGSNVTIAKYDAATAIGAGLSLFVSGSYEAN